MKLREIWSGTAVRTAAVYAGTISVAVIAVFTAVYLEIQWELNDRLKVRTGALIQNQVALARSSGLDVLTRTIAEEVAATPKPDRIMLVVDPGGNFVAGNIAPVGRFDDWQYLARSGLRPVDTVRLTDDESRFLARWTTLPDGHGLLVGLSDHDVEEAREELLEGLAYGLAAAVLAATAAAVWLGAINRRRIHAIGDALARVAGGDLGQRVPLSGGGDELDQVAGRVNAMLGDMGTLVESLRQVSADIAHELRTPVGHLRQDLEAALDNAATAADLKEAVARAIGHVDRISGVFDALLRIAQIEAGTRRSRFAVLSLNDLVEDTVDIFRNVAEEAGHTLSATLPSNVQEIDGDRELLTQMLANLIENAIRHCPPGASISVVLEGSPDGPVVRVLDDGPGVPKDERQNVQRRLYRLEKSRSSPGTGLGLSLVRAIADLHRARLSLGDNGPGLSVTIRFPA